VLQIVDYNAETGSSMTDRMTDVKNLRLRNAACRDLPGYTMFRAIAQPLGKSD